MRCSLQTVLMLHNSLPFLPHHECYTTNSLSLLPHHECCKLFTSSISFHITLALLQLHTLHIVSSMLCKSIHHIISIIEFLQLFTLHITSLMLYNFHIILLLLFNLLYHFSCTTLYCGHCIMTVIQHKLFTLFH